MGVQPLFFSVDCGEGGIGISGAVSDNAQPPSSMYSDIMACLCQRSGRGTPGVWDLRVKGDSVLAFLLCLVFWGAGFLFKHNRTANKYIQYIWAAGTTLQGNECVSAIL